MSFRMIQDSEELIKFREIIQFLSLKASAGSGKTHNLAKRYIQLLKSIPTSLLGSIIAITFTNKASAEMKERIIKFLKGLAGIGENKLDELNIDTQESRQILLGILKNFDDFNVTTIDSFMNTLYKAFAADIGVYPDYDITFNTDEIYKKSVDMLLQDNRYLETIIDFLNTQLRFQKDGINGEEIIRIELKNYYKKQSFENLITYSDLEKMIIDKLCLQSESNLDIVDVLKDKIKNLSDQLTLIVSNPAFNGNRIKPYKDIDLKKLKDNYEKYKYLLDSNDLSGLLKKNSTLSNNDAEAFLKTLSEMLKIYRFYLVLRTVKEMEGVVELLKILRKKEEELKQSLNIVDGSNLASGVKTILEKDYGVTYAFCKLGERIKHYLIDEFQDTSREQFDAIYPLLENSHSQDGSIFIVGDKKQSIYGWRGGDYSLFDEIEEKMQFQLNTLDTNYRSGKNIVNFNNLCFSDILPQLESEIFISSTDDFDEFKEMIKNEIYNVYKDAFQKDDGKDKYAGYINIHLLPDNGEIDIEEFYKKRLFGLIKNLLDRGYRYSDIMILVRGNDEIVEIVDWLYNSVEFNTTPFITDGNLKIMNNFDIKRILLVASYILNKEDEFYMKSLAELNITDIDNLSNLDYSVYSPYEFFCEIIRKLGIKNDIYVRRFLEEVYLLTSKNMTTREIINYFYDNKDISISSPEEVDAIKIMSIHKSKGLESKVVILPCFDWELYRKDKIYDYLPLTEFIEGYNGNEQIFALLNNFVNISKTAKDRYYDKLRSQIIEGLNLMYVAMTRAERELFITGSIKFTKGDNKSSGDQEVHSKLSYKKPVQVSAILREFLLRLNDQQKKLPFVLEDKGEDGLFFVYGEMSDIKEDKKKIPISKKLREKIYSPDYIIKRIRDSFVEEIDVEDVREGQKVGNIIHKVLSFIKIIKDENSIESEIRKGFYYANIPFDESISESIEKTINDLKDYFIGIDDCWTEKEFVTEFGNTFRIDRLVKRGKKYFVIDYKTGNPKDEDLKQVATYCKIIPDSEGLIYYLNGKGAIYVQTSIDRS